MPSCWPKACSGTTEVAPMSPLVPCCLLAATAAAAQSGEELLAKIADASNRRHAVAYSGSRKYSLRNVRFSQSATVFVQMTHRPSEGKRFHVLERSGSDRLAGIVERLLATEADASKPANRAEYEINPANYSGRLRGMGAMAGRSCYIVEVTPKRKSKFLIQGTVWVDRNSYEIVRLEGSTFASLSLWIGKPEIVEEFREIGGFWLPSHVRSVSSGTLLGTSELEIHYSDYRLPDSEPAGSLQVGRIPSASRNR